MAEGRPLQRFLDKFLVLQGAARELWVTFLVKFLGITAYKVTNVTLVLWLSTDLGFGDEKAFGLVAAWSLSMTIGTLLVGSLTDAIGLRRTFFLGAWICVFARAVMVFTTVKWLALVAGLFPLAFGEALGTPVLVAAIRQYSTTRQRSISFSLFYTIMNLGFLVAGLIFDWVRSGVGEYGHLSLPLVHTTVTSYRALFLVSLAVELTILPVLCLMRTGVEVTDEGVTVSVPKPRYPGANLLRAFWLTVRDSVVATVNLFRGLVKQAGFHRLLGFLMLIAFLKLIFMQIDYVFPKFGIRELGPGAPVGKLASLNNLFIIILAPIVGALTQRFTAYRMVILGGIISSASIFIMSLPTGWFESLAGSGPGLWFGHFYLRLEGPVHPYYIMTLLFILLLSVGEAFYSPRVYEYAAAIAPKGQEASYAALSYVPFLLAKLLVGTVSGPLMAKYCPEVGERHSGTMWFVIALLTTISPIGLIALQRFIRVHEAGREE